MGCGTSKVSNLESNDETNKNDDKKEAHEGSIPVVLTTNDISSNHVTEAIEIIDESKQFFFMILYKRPYLVRRFADIDKHTQKKHSYRALEKAALEIKSRRGSRGSYEFLKTREN